MFVACKRVETSQCYKINLVFAIIWPSPIGISVNGISLQENCVNIITVSTACLKCLCHLKRLRIIIIIIRMLSICCDVNDIVGPGK